MREAGGEGYRRGSSPFRDEDDIELDLRLPPAKVELGGEGPVPGGLRLEMDVRRTTGIDSGGIGGEPGAPLRIHVLDPPVFVIVATPPVRLPPLDPSPGQGLAVGNPEEPAPDHKPAARGRTPGSPRLVESARAVGSGAL